MDQIIFVAIDKNLVGHFLVRDNLKEGIKPVIAELMRHYDVYLCTAEDDRVAKACAKELKIKPENVRADCVPADLKQVVVQLGNQKISKQQLIQELKEKGKIVAMVGDGPNDVIALTESCLGVAVCSEFSDITEANAGLFINKPTLNSLPQTLDIARQTNQQIDSSLKFNIAYNMLAMALPFVLFFTKGITLHPGICALFMVVQAGLLLNSVRTFKSEAMMKFGKLAGASPNKLLDESGVRRDPEPKSPQVLPKPKPGLSTDKPATLLSHSSIWTGSTSDPTGTKSFTKVPLTDARGSEHSQSAQFH